MNNEDAGTEAPQFASAGKCGYYGGHYDRVIEKDALYEVGSYEAGGVTSYFVHCAATYLAAAEIALAQGSADAPVEVENDKYQHHEKGIPYRCKEVDDKQQEGCDSARQVVQRFQKSGGIVADVFEKVHCSFVVKGSDNSFLVLRS